MFQAQQWLRVGDYEIIVHAVKEIHLPKSGRYRFNPPDMIMPDGAPVQVAEGLETERVIYINVAYRNHTQDKTLSCRRNQWYLYDSEGYSYEAESKSNHLYAGQDRRYFGGERFLNPGTQVRGWLAFKLPGEAALERLQFITAFLGTKAADIDLSATF